MYTLYLHCTPVSEMTYTVLSGTLNSTVPYHSLQCSDTVGRQAGHPACKKLGVVLILLPILLEYAHLIAPVVTTTSVILSCNKTG